MSGKRININGEQLCVQDTDISYEQLVELAGKRGTPTVTYSVRRGDGAVRSGSLCCGQRIALEDGMTFTVIHTDRA